MTSETKGDLGAYRESHIIVQSNRCGHSVLVDQNVGNSLLICKVHKLKSIYSVFFKVNF